MVFRLRVQARPGPRPASVVAKGAGRSAGDSVHEAAGKLRVLLLDCHAVVREGLKLIVASQPDMEVAGESDEAHDAVLKACALRPDVLVADVGLPNRQGWEAVAAVARGELPVRIVGLSVYEDVDSIRRAIDAGARGYVLKRSAPEGLTKAIRAVAHGDVYLDPALGGKLADLIAGRTPGSSGDRIRRLSARETEVLRMLAWGFSHGEIAERISVSPRTVETYRSRLMAKLDFQRKSDLVRYAVQHGWLTEDGVP